MKWYKNLLRKKKNPKYIVAPINGWGCVNLKPGFPQFFNVIYERKNEAISFLEKKYNKPYFKVKQDEQVEIVEIQLTMKNPVLYE